VENEKDDHKDPGDSKKINNKKRTIKRRRATDDEALR
jgi:hypothetical protein